MRPPLIVATGASEHLGNPKMLGASSGSSPRFAIHPLEEICYHPQCLSLSLSLSLSLCLSLSLSLSFSLSLSLSLSRKIYIYIYIYIYTRMNSTCILEACSAEIKTSQDWFHRVELRMLRCRKTKCL